MTSVTLVWESYFADGDCWRCRVATGIDPSLVAGTIARGRKSGSWRWNVAGVMAGEEKTFARALQVVEREIDRRSIGLLGVDGVEFERLRSMPGKRAA